jgi:hypothetical protein
MSDRVEPLWSIVSGRPTEIEVAALAVVLSGLNARPGSLPARPRPSGVWGSPRSTLRQTVPGRDAWRLSFHPGA